MKSIHEMLTRIKIDIEGDGEDFTNGMCATVIGLAMRGILSQKEEFHIDYYISRNKPSGVFNAYWWKSGDPVPRIEWLNYHLSINKPR